MIRALIQSIACAVANRVWCAIAGHGWESHPSLPQTERCCRCPAVRWERSVP
jgi:hypothetical protein